MSIGSSVLSAEILQFYQQRFFSFISIGSSVKRKLCWHEDVIKSMIAKCTRNLIVCISGRILLKGDNITLIQAVQ